MHSTSNGQPDSQADSKADLDPTLLADCQRWIDHRLGLHFPPQAWHDLSRHLALLARELGYQASRDLVQDLLTGSGHPRLEQRLTEALTVNETYFFRDPACFQHLANTVLRPLIHRRRVKGPKQLRLWSAGCSTGEEAYSLAMLVDGLLGDADAWQITILGTDVSRENLARARQGVYGAWSFRRVADATSIIETKSRYFQPVPAEVVGGKAGKTRFWRIKAELGSRVRFFELNLAAPFYPDQDRGLANVDVILCRNVLMYFSPAQAIAVLKRLVQCLSDDGILLVGAVDGNYCQSAGLATTNWPGALAIPARPCPAPTAEEPDRLRSGLAQTLPEFTSTLASPPPKKGRSSPVEPSVPALDSGQPADHGIRRRASQALADGNYQEAQRLAERYLQQGGLTLWQEAEAAILCARILANLKQLDEAEYWARQAIQLDRLQPACYWVLATILLERNRREEARDILSKALYLQPDFALAQYLSGLISKQLHHRRRARRDLRNCLEQLALLPQGEAVPEGEGLSAADLRQLATAVLADLENDGNDRNEGSPGTTGSKGMKETSNDGRSRAKGRATLG